MVDYTLDNLQAYPRSMFSWQCLLIPLNVYFRLEFMFTGINANARVLWFVYIFPPFVFLFHSYTFV